MVQAKDGAASVDKDMQAEIENNALSFFRTNTKSIELQFKDKNLYRIFFPLPPVCMHLTPQKREDIMGLVQRDSSNQKINDLIGFKKELFDEMINLSYRSRRWFTLSAEKFNTLNKFATIGVSITINCIILYYFERKVVSTQSYIVVAPINFNFSWIPGVELEFDLDTEMVIRVLGIIQLVTSILMICFWFVIYSPLILKKQWRQYNEDMHNQFLEELAAQGGG